MLFLVSLSRNKIILEYLKYNKVGYISRISNLKNLIDYL